VRRSNPDIVAFVGITLYRAIFEKGRARSSGGPVRCGFQRERFEGARVFVLPNPSGRNATLTYPQMRAAYRALARALRTRPIRD
jgi:double-stranded uracil-DNA glycosylase